MIVRLPYLALFAACITCGNGPSGGPDARPDDGYDRTALLQRLTAGIIVPLYEQFEVDAAALATATQDYCSALGGADEATALAGARGAWSAAMATWQRAELTQLGPTGATGGALRDGIYSWTVVSSCAVDQDVMMLRNDPTGYDITVRLTNRRGLDSLEYALFATSLEHTCPPQVPPEGWDALSEADRRAARCGYAALAATDLATQATALTVAWSGADGFADVLVAAGQDGNPFATAHDGVDAVFGAMFYLETWTKDQKLAKPLGLQASTCGPIGTVCPADLESQHARASRAHVAANLAGFRALFTGGDGEGFDDFLRALGAGALADEMNAALDVADASVGSFDGTFADALAGDASALQGVHADVKEVTDRLKNEMPPTLGLTIPGEAGGDTD